MRLSGVHCTNIYLVFLFFLYKNLISSLSRIVCISFLWREENEAQIVLVMWIAYCKGYEKAEGCTAV